MFFTLPRTTMALAILHDIVLFSQIFHVFFLFVQLSSLRFSLLSMSKGENSLPVCLVVLENRGSKPWETWHFTSSKTQHDRSDSVFLFTTFPPFVSFSICFPPQLCPPMSLPSGSPRSLLFDYCDYVPPVLLLVSLQSLRELQHLLILGCPWR